MRVTIVSSGAIGAGLRELNLPKRPTDLARLQAVAAVGQRRLMDVLGEAFEPYKLPVAQILLTREDIDHRTRFLNVRNTIHAVHELGGVPIINENDTISTDELVQISFGDNDILAALVTHALRADLLVLLSVVDGILDAGGQPVRLVENVAAARELVRAEKSALGQRRVQLQARSRADGDRVRRGDGGRRRADGKHPAPPARRRSRSARSSCPPPASGRAAAGGSAAPARPARSSSTTGAVRALVEQNKSLLPAGIVKVEGDFARGDVVTIQSADGQFDCPRPDQLRRRRGRAASAARKRRKSGQRWAMRLMTR